LLKEPAFDDQPWQRWRVKDGDKGPMIWEVKHAPFFPKDEDGLPARPQHLIVARSVLDPTVVKFFVSNAPPETPLQRILLVGFSRWRIERCFEDQKGEVGLDHYEGRRYLGLKRHLVLSAISYLFLARTRQELGGGKSGADGIPSAYSDRIADSLLVA
jgi:SRSO17 transposase